MNTKTYHAVGIRFPLRMFKAVREYMRQADETNQHRAILDLVRFALQKKKLL